MNTRRSPVDNDNYSKLHAFGWPRLPGDDERLPGDPGYPDPAEAELPVGLPGEINPDYPYVPDEGDPTPPEQPQSDNDGIQATS